jgi:hypothetical protein
MHPMLAICRFSSAALMNAFGFDGACVSLRGFLGHTDIPALREDNAQEEEKQKHSGANPAVGCVWGRGIEVRLVSLSLRLN